MAKPWLMRAFYRIGTSVCNFGGASVPASRLASSLAPTKMIHCFFWLAICLGNFCVHAADVFPIAATNATARVIVVQDAKATVAFQPDGDRVQLMVERGLTNLTGKATPAAAWRSLVSTNDVVGIKVFSEAGEICGTRPAVVAAVVRGLLAAGVPHGNIVIWDRYEEDLDDAGFFQLADQLNVRAAGAAEAGYDPTNFYNPDSAVIGNLVWGDLDFGKKGAGIGRKSFISMLVSRQMTKIISIAPLLDENSAGLCGHLYSLALGSVDNIRRFEDDPDRLAVALPEIYALPALGDRVVLNITDALLGQYSGGPRGFLQYSTTPNQIWFSRDPVALDLLALRELQRERLAVNMAAFKPNFEIYTNAVLLELGVGDPGKIRVEKTLMPE